MFINCIRDKTNNGKIMGYDEPNPAANQQIRRPAKQNLDEHERRSYARLVRLGRGPNNLALVKKRSLTTRGGGGHSEMRFLQG